MNTMQVNNSLPVTPGAPGAPVRVQQGDREKFTDMMRMSMERQDSASQTQEEQLKSAANQLVSVAFIKPMMAQMRESPFKNDMFHGGNGETMFQEHLDTVLSDRIAGRTNYSIADAIYKKIAGLTTLNHTAIPGHQPSTLNQHG